MRCDGSPNPTIPGEINTYINLRLEDNAHNDIDSVLKQAELDLSVRFRLFQLSFFFFCKLAFIYYNYGR